MTCVFGAAHAGIPDTGYVAKQIASAVEDLGTDEIKANVQANTSSIQENWGKVPVKQDGEQTGTVQIWVE